MLLPIRTILARVAPVGLCARCSYADTSSSRSPEYSPLDGDGDQAATTNRNDNPSAADSNANIN